MATKTPSRNRHARPPLTPSALSLGLSSLSLSPTKPTTSRANRGGDADSSNPFLDRKNSPVKSRSNSGGSTLDHLAKEAKRGVVRPGSFESKLDVVKLDYIPPAKQENRLSPKKTKSRSNT
ncbi:ubiquitin-protein transferase activating protein, partial [Tulasnella sp. 418]